VIVDSSALLAILRGEPDAAAFERALAGAVGIRISAGNYLEVAIVVDALRDAVASRLLDAFLEAAGIVIEPVTVEQARLGRAAYRDFGRGSGHPARLNFGDCFAYALASVTGEPLLFKGLDFASTDVRAAIPPSDSTT
jgi:ribonuclease VapC